MGRGRDKYCLAPQDTWLVQLDPSWYKYLKVIVLCTLRHSYSPVSASDCTFTASACAVKYDSTCRLATGLPVALSMLRST